MRRLSFSSKASFFLGCVVSFIGCLVLYWGLNSLKDASESDPANAFRDQNIEVVLKEIGTVVNLPEKETPQVATVSDASQLSGQLFFVGAQNGDMVLIFNIAQKAILYRPTTKKVINYSSVVLPPQAQATPSASLSPSISPKNNQKPTPTTISSKAIRVVILNGTKEKGLAKKADDMLKSENFEVLLLGNTKGDYKTSSYSIISKDKKIANADIQKAVARASKVTFTQQSYPKGEDIFSNADLVLILGEDFAKAY